MSNVIAFRADRRMPPRTLPTSETSQILLFTGIRYIRDEPGDAVEPTATLPSFGTPPHPASEDRLQA